MRKRFNITGLCNPGRHWMVDISGKIAAIIAMVEAGDYLMMNRPRQYGKSTTLFMLENALLNTREILPVSISFEGIDAPTFQSHDQFIATFLGKIVNELKRWERQEMVKLVEERLEKTRDFFLLDQLIEQLCQGEERLVLMIDEVDSASNNQLFLDFLGMLRNKYLERNKGKGHTFLSVILAGVHDVTTLKRKIRRDEEQKYNSPWNIAAAFDIEMEFSIEEISSLLTAYSRDTQVMMDIPAIARKIHYYTSGYPFLTSCICKIVDEKILPAKNVDPLVINENDVEMSVMRLLKESNTNFSSLIKNLENDTKLYQFIKSIAIEGQLISFHITDSLIMLARTYGMIAEENGNCKIHNRIYEQLIYDHMMVKLVREKRAEKVSQYNIHGKFTRDDGSLDFEKVLVEFQQFMKEQYSLKDRDFLERNGRLVFQAFLKPIINGRGFDFKEAQISEERRLDIVVTWGNTRYVVELKIWRGEEIHQKGLRQLVDYLERIDAERGYLVVFASRGTHKNNWQSQTITMGQKEIFMVVV